MIQLFQNFFAGHTGTCLKIRHLPQSVNACVGAARAGQFCLFLQQTSQYGCQLALNGIFVVFLTLPAAVPGAVVLNIDFYVSHKLRVSFLYELRLFWLSFLSESTSPIPPVSDPEPPHFPGPRPPS